MTLLQELLSLNEGHIKNEIIDRITMISSFLSEDDAEEGDLKPKILAKSVPTKGVTYMVVMDPRSEEVQIVDSSHKVYLQVPFIVWQQLARQG